MRGLVAFDVSPAHGRRSTCTAACGAGRCPTPPWWPPAWPPACTTSDGRVTLPGFYDDVREPRRPPRRRRWPPSPSTRPPSGPRPAGSPTWRARPATRPSSGSASARPPRWSGLHGGYGGPGIKTIVPATAGFKVAFRLVPDQRPDAVDAAFRAWLAERVPAGVEVDRHPGGRRGAGADARSTTRPWGPWAGPSSGYGGSPPLYTREGGSGPEEALGRVLEAPVLFLGVGPAGRPDPRPQRADGDGSVLEGPGGGGRAAARAGRSLRWPRTGAEPRTPRRARPARPCRRPGPRPDAHEWVSFEDPEEDRHLGVRRDVPAVPLAVHLRAGLPGRADRAGRGAGAGLLLVRGPLHRRRRRGPGQGGGQDPRPTTSGSSPPPAGAAAWCAPRRTGPGSPGWSTGPASSSTGPASPAAPGAPCTGPRSARGQAPHRAQARRVLAAAAAAGGHHRRRRAGDLDGHPVGPPPLGRRRRGVPLVVHRGARGVHRRRAGLREHGRRAGRHGRRAPSTGGWSAYLRARRSTADPAPPSGRAPASKPRRAASSAPAVTRPAPSQGWRR